MHIYMYVYTYDPIFPAHPYVSCRRHGRACSVELLAPLLALPSRSLWHMEGNCLVKASAISGKAF